MNYRKLSESETRILENQGCSAIDGWDNVLVSNTFIPNTIKNTVFSGLNHLGELKEKIVLENYSDIAGIYNAHLHNCVIENNVYIRNIGTIISDYKICSNAIIINVGSLKTDGNSNFGNGIKVSAVNEGGGREIYIYDELSVQTAYLMAFYSYNKKLQENIRRLISDYVEKIASDKGTVESYAQVINCKTISNTKIGGYAKIEGVSYLNNATINSNKDASTYIGHDVNASDFIVCSSSTVSNGAYLRNCFVGQGCEISNHFTAENSVFFANSQCLQGEACSIFAGPYTVTHHKSTLLIAGAFSFYNAGSGTNQSNHMYKLGPVHQGITERGCKTGSDSYVLWPGHIGAFTMVLGRHYSNPETIDFPFSYLIEDDGKSVLMPAQNIFSVGTARDTEKWPKRDKRKGICLDQITFDAFNPFTIDKIILGIKTLKGLNEKASDKSKSLMHKGVQISLSAIKRGINLYEQALIKYIGDEIISFLNEENFEDLKKSTKLNNSEWVDIGGLICFKQKINELIKSAENGRYNLKDISVFFITQSEDYKKLKREHAFYILNSYFKIDISKCSKSDIADFINNWIEVNNKIFSSISMDAKKEFNAKSKISFGIDGNDDDKNMDFESVRGSFENNSYINTLKQNFENLNNTGFDIIYVLK